MREIPFEKLVNWVLEEYRQSHSIFGIPESKFYWKNNAKHIKLSGESLDTPVGPAAGPHTQLAQNIISAYLCGGRFFELKTVQVLDKLEFPKPCIKAEDECYNTEWSTELSIEGAFAEYVKAWFVLHILQKEIFNHDERGFIFNMSVGYDLIGIQSPKVDKFIEGLKDASHTDIFQECRRVLYAQVFRWAKVDAAFIDSISPHICNSITISTMHGCPPAEIEAISKYLIGEKKLHTLVKMNPTLLGYRYVKDIFEQMGYDYVQLKEESFTHDLQYDDGVAMLKRLKGFAREHAREFGVKLSNTLPVKIGRGELPGDEMYMSGRSLYPLTINLAYKLAAEFRGDLWISYAGGADFDNVGPIFATGIRPITVASTLLKPGGYLRLKQLAEVLENQLDNGEPGRIDMVRLRELAAGAVQDANYLKAKRVMESRKISMKLPLTDCFIDPCSIGCPINQDIPEYIRLAGEGRYREALEVIVAKNPLPFVTGTICTHECTTKCTRLDYDESVFIREMKLVAAQHGYEEFMHKMPEHRPRVPAQVAVIGAGPSGLAAGYFLSRAGMNVTIFDKREKAGGIVEYVIPDFRIPKTTVHNDIELIKRAGVKFEFGADPDFSIKELQAKGFDYIYLAIGAGKSNSVKLEGQQALEAIPFLERFKKNPASLGLGPNVAIIGGGNSAMDAARAALRVKGVAKVYIIYRRTKEYMPAAREELVAALEEGAILKELLTPVSLDKGVLRCQKMQLGATDDRGRRSPVMVVGEFEDIPIDMVITATGEFVDHDLLRVNGIKIDPTGNVIVNPATLETNIANVFIGGDALFGPSTVVEAIAHAAKAAAAMMAKENIADGREIKPNMFEYERQLLEIENKKGILRHGANLELEPSRCLECNTLCNVCTEVCPNRANLAIQLRHNSLHDANQIIHLDGMCNQCGNCMVFCPYAGAPYLDKFTLFWNEEDFGHSDNSGFLLLNEGAQPVFKLRLDGRVFEAGFDADGKFDVPIDDKIASLVWTVYTYYPYLL